MNLAGCILLYLVMQNSEGREVDFVNRLRSEGPPAWKQLLDKSRVCESISHVEFSGPNSDQHTEEFGMGPDGRYLVYESKAGKQQTRAIGINNQYSFEVVKSGDGKWVASNVVIKSNGQSAREVSIPEVVPNNILVGISPNLPLAELVNDHSCEIKFLKSEGNLLRYELTPPVVEGRPRLSRIEILLAPEDFWIIKEMVVVEGNGLVSKSVLESKVTDGIPSVTSRITTGVAVSPDGKQIEMRATEKFEQHFSFKSRDIPRYTLSAYGLPEPPGTSILSRSFPNWLVALIAGVALVGVGSYFARRKST